MKPGCPNLIERIESGLLSCGNDFDSGDNPYECGFDQYIDVKSNINYLSIKIIPMSLTFVPEGPVILRLPAS